MVFGKRRRKRGLAEDVKDFTAANVLTSTGATVTADLGGNTQGFTNIGRGFKPLGTVIGAKALIRATKSLDQQKKKKRKRRSLF